MGKMKKNKERRREREKERKKQKGRKEGREGGRKTKGAVFWTLLLGRTSVISLISV